MSLQSALDWLSTQQNADGSWGYLPGQPGHGEPTVLAAAAGIEGAQDWLTAAPPAWWWLLAPAAQASGPLVDRGLEHILSETNQGQPSPAPGTYDGMLIGWNWWSGTFSWVHPTAWAVLSLRNQGQEAHARCQAGLQVLRDRQCVDGGWNAGTPNTLGADLPGYLYMTGWVCLALPPSREAGRGLIFLEKVKEWTSTLNLSTAILARTAHGLESPELVERLLARQQADGSFGGYCDRTAIAACALRAVEFGDCPLVRP